MTLRQAINWASDIKSFTQRRIMPPWKVTEGVAFHHERRLTDREIATLAAWADGGTPAGDPKDAPPPAKFPAGWQLGTPDLVLTVPDDFTLGPTGSDLFRCFVLPTGLKEDKWVAAIEVRPGNPRIVHHALLVTDIQRQGRKLETKAQEREKSIKIDPEHPTARFDRGPGYSITMGVGFIPSGGLLGWAPGQTGRYLPEGSGLLLHKDADVVMQLHYHRNGRLERDRTQVGVYFATKPVTHPYKGGIMVGGSKGSLIPYFFTIPAGAERFHLEGDSWATADFTLHSVMPHMHMIGKEVKVTFTPPDGKERVLIHIKEWDYNWQETYFLKEPIAVKAGTRFHLDAWYDNSAKNPHNPFNPPRRISFGEQTTNEMCFVFLGGTGGTGGRTGRLLPLSLSGPKKAKAEK
jgi:hypothetical protein